MATTVFVNGVTLTDADWFNDEDALLYDVFNEKSTAGTSGTILRSNGTNIVNTTATYPTTTTSTRVLYSTGANAIGDSANLTFDGTTLTAHTATISTGLLSAVTVTASGLVTAQAALTVSAGSLTVTGGTITTGATTSLSLATSGGTQFQVVNTANAVNYWQFTGGISTSEAVYAQAAGADAAVGFLWTAKGVGGHDFTTNSIVGNKQFTIAHTASAVNYIQVTGGITGTPGVAVITATGSDAAIDLLLVTTGTGVLRFGTLTVLGAETVTGYITIKDAGGTSRKLAVVS